MSIVFGAEPKRLEDLDDWAALTRRHEMYAVSAAQVRSVNALPRPHTGSSADPELLDFTPELDGAVAFTRWRREENCAALLTEGGLCWVLSGIVRKSVVHESGQRRIVDLIMPGDFFALGSDDAGSYSFEAVTEGTLTARLTQRNLIKLAKDDPRLYRLFYQLACDVIARLESQLLVQGRTTATEKIAAYLLLMSTRLSGAEDGAVVLPVSRYDIADHLGIAVETVSRAMTELRRAGLIKLNGPRRIAMTAPRKLI
ncbi:Crp/Fnr family transcriptional regulator [Hansschlegelia sp.]|uniref:Crp/Fnr family transcriptional regulator n=1 Tax=Hansschlegelia sp. TaxID=2041892 RepID=UPI002C578EAD|nr:Crp/Fnr family transcriptional regulator [Hansschlegelia sp.]HVI29973.1 Crp/Fnr family transcriptional regulator [Hansschlegelia sp.]